LEPYGRNQFSVLESRPVTENSSQALVRADTEAALCAAIEFWAEGSTRAETIERAYKLRDKTRVVRGFFAFAGKYPGEVATEDIQRWRAHLEAQGQKAATVYARVSRVSAFFKWL